MSEPKLYTCKEFAEVLNVHPVTVRKWICNNKIDVVRIGRCVRIPATEIDKFYTGNQRKETE